MATLLSLPNELLLMIARYSATDKARYPGRLALWERKIPTLRDTSSLLRTCKHLASTLTEVLYEACLADKGSLALEWAASTNNITVAKLLIETYNSDVDVRAEKRYQDMPWKDRECGPASTPLHIAALHGSIDIANYLLGKGANPSAVTKSFVSPDVAFDESDEITDAMRLSLLQGFVDSDYGHIWFSAQPVHLAAISGHVDIVKLLESRGGDISSTCSSVELANYQSYAQWSLVDIAVHGGNYAMFKYLTHDDSGLLKEGIDFNTSTDLDISTPIELLLEGSRNFDSMSIAKQSQIEAILSAILAADNIELLSGSQFSSPILAQAAAMTGSLTLLKILMNKMGVLDRTPEAWLNDEAMCKDDLQCLQADLDGALYNQVADPVYYGGELQYTAIALLVSSGANINCDLFPFHEYIDINHSKSAAGIRFLVSQGAVLDLLDSEGYTPLFIALKNAAPGSVYSEHAVALFVVDPVKHKEKACIMELLHLGADVEVARRLAMKEGYPGAELLLDVLRREEYDREMVDRVYSREV